MANGYISQVQLSNNETYNIKDKEIIPRLEATVGHSCKNLCNLQNASVTQPSGNVSFVANTSSGEVTVTGTTASNKNYIVACMRGISGIDMPVGDFYVSGCPDGGTDSTYYMYAYDNTTNNRVKQWDGTTASISAYNSNESIKVKFVEGHDVSVRIIVCQGTSVSGLVFRPMLRDGSISDDTFEPYVTPTDERIELVNRTYLEATVGHSSKNLFDRQFRQGTVANTTTTSSVCSTTIIKTTNGATHRFKCFDNNFAIRVYGLNEAGKQQILSGLGVTAANRLFDSDYIFSGTYEHTNDNSNIVAYAIMLRKTSTPGQEVWIDITPSDVPNNILMVVKSPLTIDTFEPYVTPTDEKKQDKPLRLALPSSDTAVIWDIDITDLYKYFFVIMQRSDNKKMSILLPSGFLGDYILPDGQSEINITLVVDPTQTYSGYKFTVSTQSQSETYTIVKIDGVPA